MRIATFHSLGATVFLAVASHAADTGGLSVSGVGILFTNDSSLRLVIGLVNTTNHDVTVFTKQRSQHPDAMLIPIGETSKPKKLLCRIGLEDEGKWAGHQIVPSLSDFAPVTLKSNEAAMVRLKIELKEELRSVTKDTEIVIEYKVLPKWGARFGCWSGEIQSPPFKATQFAVPAKKP
jgi:hypothetical protein